MIQLIFLLVGLLLGGLASVVIIKGSKTKWEAEHKYILKDKENLAEQLANAQDDLAKYDEQIDELKSIISEQKTTIANLELKIENYDAMVLAVAHDEFKKLNSKISTINSQLVTFDIKSILDKSDGRL